MAARCSARSNPTVVIPLAGQNLSTTSGSSIQCNSKLVNDDLSDSDSGPPEKKRRNKIIISPWGRSRAKKTGGRRGKLGKLPEMPLDILYEIFGHLNPGDVLHLAQTTKSLRNILMRRSARSVWKAAFSNIEGFPPCPSDLNEAQYADLAFVKRCHFCSTSNAQRPLLACRVRCCRKCEEVQCIDYNGFCQEFISNNCRFPLSLSDMLGMISVPRDARYGPRPVDGVWFKNDLSKFVRQLCGLPKNKEAVTDFFKQRRSMVAERRAHEIKYYDYQDMVAERRKDELKNARDRRKKAIFAKLTDLGWGEEIKDIENYPWRSWGEHRRSLPKHPLVKQPKDLTDRIWKNIMPTLVEYLENRQAARLKHEREQLIRARMVTVTDIVRKYLRTQPVTEAFPGPADYCYMEDFEEIITSPSEMQITEESFAELVPKLPVLEKAWRQARNRELLAVMAREGTSAVPGSTAEEESVNDFFPLDLATTFFSVNCRCSQPISYPRILAHHCLIDGWSNCPRDKLSELSAGFYPLGRPWNYTEKQITFCQKASDLAGAIVTACQKDPNVTTAVQMDQMDPWMECLSCIEQGKPFSSCTFNWRQMILHSLKHDESNDLSPGHQLWRILDQDDASSARKYAIDFLKNSRPAFNSMFPNILCPGSQPSDECCVRCRAIVGKGTLVFHLKQSHEIERAAEEGDFVHHLDISMMTYPFAGMTYPFPV